MSLNYNEFWFWFWFWFFFLEVDWKWGKLIENDQSSSGGKWHRFPSKFLQIFFCLMVDLGDCAFFFSMFVIGFWFWEKSDVFHLQLAGNPYAYTTYTTYIFRQLLYIYIRCRWMWFSWIATLTSHVNEIGSKELWWLCKCFHWQLVPFSQFLFNK